MPKTDAYETALLSTFEGGALKSVATKAELAKFKATASTTDIYDGSLEIQPSSGDLQALQETQCFSSIPDMRESIKDGMTEPIDDCGKDIDW